MHKNSLRSTGGNWHQSMAGFTMIELMTVIAILGILVSISLPYMLSAQDRAKLASVKENMHLVQLMVETYSTDWDNRYPSDSAWLEYEAKEKGYWKSATNPFTLSTDYLFNMEPTSNALPTGTVGYRPFLADLTTYGIYGSDGYGNLLLADNQIMVLTNSK